MDLRSDVAGTLYFVLVPICSLHTDRDSSVLTLVNN